MHKFILHSINLCNIILKPHLKENHHYGKGVGKETRVFSVIFSDSVTFLFFSA